MEEFTNLKVADLRRELKSRGLNSNGTKQDLLTRLQAAISSDKPGSDDSAMDDALIDEDSMLGDEEDDSNSDVDTSTENSNSATEVTPIKLSPSKKSPEKKDPAKQIAVAVAATIPAAVAVTSTLNLNSATKSTKAEKKQNGTSPEDEVPAKKKKITINRLPVQPAAPVVPLGTSGSTETTDSAKTGDASPTATGDKTVVKLSAVATAADKEKIKLRQQKFGSALESAPAAAISGPGGEKLKKRAERFGSVGTTGSPAAGKVSLTTEDEAKLAKRRERFGPLVADIKVDSVAKDKRAARFGGQASVTAITAPVSTPEVEEKKTKRAARFAAT